MAKPMSDAIKNRAVGLKPFPDQPVRKGGTGPAVWHGLGGTPHFGLLLPPQKGPAPGRDVRPQREYRVLACRRRFRTSRGTGS